MLEYLKILIDGHAAKARSDERGATAVEYGLLVALIAAVIIVIVASVGQKVLNAFTKIDTNL